MNHPTALTRRQWLQTSAIGIGTAAGSMSGWLRSFASDAPKKPAKSVIVLWLNGGPATIDLWDLKPGHDNGGPLKESKTTAPGLRISEHLPKLAAWGKELAVIRSLSSKPGDHAQATYLLRTGYNPQGALQFPALGALVAKELGSETTDLPNFVSIAPTRYATTIGGGFLGPKLDPLMIGSNATPEAGLQVQDIKRAANHSDAEQRTRLQLLDNMEKRFQTGRTNAVVDSIQAATARAVRLMQPEAAKAFDLDEEKPKTRDAYGRGQFGQGCLLARRLVERGVPFVEVTLDGWDTHANNFELVRGLSGTLDTAFAALLADLQERGLLASTLVVCQGEFGRTPKINVNTGRDHWPASWAVTLAGGGIKAGQAIGKTNAGGTAVVERAVSVPDLIASVAKAVGIDPQKQNISSLTRPIRIADPAAKPLAELF